MNPKVTVVMPVYNSEKFLREAIESILKQTYKDFELLIIDDGSTDNSIKIINSFKDSRIVIHRNITNKGLPYTRNKGIDLAKGEYIAVMDSDDISKKNRLEREVEFLDKNYEFDIVSSKADIIENNKIIKCKLKRKKIDIGNKRLIVCDSVINSTSMFRKSFIKRYNIRYRDEYFIAQDYAFWVDCSKYTNIAILEESLLIYRASENNITNFSLKEKFNERKQLIDSIRTRCLINNDILLDEDELLIYNKIFSDPKMEFSYNELNLCKRIIKNINKKSKKKFKKELSIQYINKVIEINISKISKLKLAIDIFIYPNLKEYIKSLVKVVIL